MHRIIVIACGIIFGVFIITATAEGLTGTVKDEAGKPIQGAILWLTNHPATQTTDAAGAFSFGPITGVNRSLKAIQRERPVFKKNSILFNVSDVQQAVQLEMYNLSGKRVKTLLNDVLMQNSYTISLADMGLSSAAYIINLKIGSERYIHQTVVQGNRNVQFGTSVNSSAFLTTGSANANRKESVFDVLHCEADGYINQEKNIPSYSMAVDFVMSEADNTPPVIDLLGIDTVWCKLGDDSIRAQYFRQGTWQLRITDNRDTGTNISSVVPTSVSIDTTIPGLHWIQYSAIDLSFNIGYARRMLILYDTTISDDVAPVLTVTPETVNMAVGELWVDTGVTAKDAIDSTLNLDIWISRTTTGILSEDTPPTFTAISAGTHTITYRVIDTHKNAATRVRTFIVSP